LISTHNFVHPEGVRIDSQLKNLVIAAVAGLILSGCGVRVIVRPPDEPLRSSQTASWLAEVEAVAQTGDWLVLRGYHGTDHLVSGATNHPLSHVAVVDRENEEIIEAVGAGIQTMSLRERIHESHRVLVIRPRWWTPERGLEAAARARELVGGDYDFLGTVGMGSDERFYCSELGVHLYRAYHDALEHFPRVVEPGHMYLYGRVLYDSRFRN